MNFKNNKSRVLVGATVSAVSLSLTGMGATQSSAQSTAPQALPPVSIDAPPASTCDEHRAVAWHGSALGPRRAPAAERAARVGKRDSHDDGHNPYDRNSRAILRRRSVGAGRNARPPWKQERNKCPVQHDELYVATDPGPAGTNSGGYADQQFFGRASTGQNGSTTRSRSAASLCPQATSVERYLRVCSSSRVPSYFIERIELLLGPGASSTVSLPAAASAAASTSSPSGPARYLSHVSPRSS